MRIVALDNYDNVQEGTSYDCPDHQALKLIEKGLAKMGPVPQNKMAAPSSNKANPSPAAGEAQPSSASQAAQASPQTTAQPYPGGGLVTPDPRLAQAEAAAAKPKRAYTRRAKSSS
jgi:hypothetical protein